MGRTLAAIGLAIELDGGGGGFGQSPAPPGYHSQFQPQFQSHTPLAGGSTANYPNYTTSIFVGASGLGMGMNTGLGMSSGSGLGMSTSMGGMGGMGMGMGIPAQMQEPTVPMVNLSVQSHGQSHYRHQQQQQQQQQRHWPTGTGHGQVYDGFGNGMSGFVLLISFDFRSILSLCLISYFLCA